MSKKVILNLDLEDVRKFLSTFKTFNESQVKTLERLKELEEKQGVFSGMLDNTVGAFLCNCDNVDINNCVRPEFTMEYRDKKYTLIPNCRNTSLINKSEAVKILEINENGHHETKWTKLEDLTDKEKKEYEKDGFIIEKITLNKE
jgi:hypothetical protein